MDISLFKEKLEKSLEFFKDELKLIRTGRANPALVEGVTVDYYSTPTPLKQVASISVPEPRMIVIAPYDRSILAGIEKAISESDLGLSASNDGIVVRVTLPTLTEETRNEFAKMAHQKAEEARVTMRNIRREAIEEVEKQEKAGEISEDDRDKQKKEIQEKLDTYTKHIDEAVTSKEAEIKVV
ncbi:ribosome recycling factor [bacterium]|nr:ribosome recycling factor [bacterium]